MINDEIKKRNPRSQWFLVPLASPPLSYRVSYPGVKVCSPFFPFLAPFLAPAFPFIIPPLFFFHFYSRKSWGSGRIFMGNWNFGFRRLTLGGGSINPLFFPLSTYSPPSNNNHSFFVIRFFFPRCKTFQKKVSKSFWGERGRGGKENQPSQERKERKRK